jgi:hypothetical protein
MTTKPASPTTIPIINVRKYFKNVFILNKGSTGS